MEHKHCKLCKHVIDEIDFSSLTWYDDWICYTLGVCKKCVIKEGIKSIKRKKRK